jgi:hypothetical protein
MEGVFSYLKKLLDIKTARFYGKGLFGCLPPLGRGHLKKLFETKTLVLVFKVDFNPKPRVRVEKLRTIKTARFCGRVLFGYKPFWFISKKLLDDKIFIFWR